MRCWDGVPGGDLGFCLFLYNSVAPTLFLLTLDLGCYDGRPQNSLFLATWSSEILLRYHAPRWPPLSSLIQSHRRLPFFSPSCPILKASNSPKDKREGTLGTQCAGGKQWTSRGASPLP